VQHLDDWGVWTPYLGHQIELRCRDSTDAVKARPTELPLAKLARIGDRITKEVPGVVSVTYNVTQKPPSTIEAI
jgi:GMP synthase (glutamine-hydrolysing)